MSKLLMVSKNGSKLSLCFLGNTQMVRMGTVQGGPIPYPAQSVSLQTAMGQMGPTQVTVQ